MLARRGVACKAAAAAVLAALVALAVPSLPALADGANATPLLRTSQPFPHGYMEYSATPGQTVQDTVTVQNGGAQVATFVLFAADGLTSQVSGVVYADRQHPFPDGPAGNGEYGAGPWVTLSAQSVTLAGGQSTSVDLSVQVPANAAPGDHVGAVSAENLAPSQQGSGQFGFNVTTRTTIAVVVHVAGPVQTAAVSVGKPFVTVENETRQILNIPLSYFGDVLVKPYVDVRVVDAHGGLLLQINRRMDTFVPHTTILFPVPLDALVLQPGTYSLLVDFGPPGAVQHFERGFTVNPAQAAVPAPSRRGHPPPPVTPWVWLLALLPLLAAAAIGAALSRRRRTCAHCGRRWTGRPVSLAEVPDAAGCGRCRVSLEHRGTRVRLCPDCYAGHRGWRKAQEVERVKQAVAG